MVSLEGVVYFVVYLIVAGLIFWLLNFLIDYLAPPEPFRKVAKVILVVLGVLLLIGLLLSFIGGRPLITFR